MVYKSFTVYLYFLTKEVIFFIFAMSVNVSDILCLEEQELKCVSLELSRKATLKVLCCNSVNLWHVIVCNIILLSHYESRSAKVCL